MEYPIPCFDPKAYYMLRDPDEKITPNFAARELKSPDVETGFILRSTLDVIQEVRTRIKLPIRINGRILKYRGYRTPDEHAKLQSINENASAGTSAHVYGAALDMSVPKGYTAEEFVADIREAEHDMGITKGRIGWRKYNGSWIHYDRVFECFEGGCNDGANPFPDKWQPGVEW